MVMAGYRSADYLKPDFIYFYTSDSDYECRNINKCINFL
jgi:hypothetical protein